MVDNNLDYQMTFQEKLLTTLNNQYIKNKELWKWKFYFLCNSGKQKDMINWVKGDEMNF